MKCNFLLATIHIVILITASTKVHAEEKTIEEFVFKEPSYVKPILTTTKYKIKCPQFMGELTYTNYKKEKVATNEKMNEIKIISASINEKNFSTNSIELANNVLEKFKFSTQFKGINCRDNGFSIFVDSRFSEKNGVSNFIDGYIFDTMFIYFSKSGEIYTQGFTREVY